LCGLVSIIWENQLLMMIFGHQEVRTLEFVIWPDCQRTGIICTAAAGIQQMKRFIYLPHWNWEGREGEITPVFVYTNFESAELFVNGKSHGIQKKIKRNSRKTLPVNVDECEI
jgi:hypothetical protein